MSDWNLPAINSNYTNMIAYLKGRDLDAIKWGEGITFTNPGAGFKRWNAASNKFERYNGTAWVDMSTAYALALGTGASINDTPIGATTQSTGGFSNVKIGTNYADNTAAKLHVSNGNTDGTGGITVDSLSPTVALVDRSVSNYSYRMRVDANSFRIEVDNGMGGTGWNAASFYLGRYGNVVLGEGAESPSVGLYVRNTLLTGTTQYGIYTLPVFKPSLVTNAAIGVRCAMSIVDEAGTIPSSYGMLIDQPTMGASGSITTAAGLWVTDFNAASIGTAYAARFAVQAGTNRWNLYASGSAPNHMAGDLRIGTTTQSGTAKLTVSGTAAVSDGTDAGHATTKGQVEGYFSSRGWLTGSIFKTAAQLNVTTLAPGNYTADSAGSVTLGLPSSDHYVTHVSFSTNYALQVAVNFYDPSLRYTRVCNAGTWTGWNVAGVTPSGSQTFTASGTFNVPTGVTEVYLTGIGGGGGGGTVTGVSGLSAATSGGPGVSAIRKKVTVTPGAAITVTIGGGGATGTGAAGAVHGSGGGTTSFGALLSLGGGAGGVGINGGASAVAIPTSYGQLPGVVNSTGTTGGQGQATMFGRGGVSGNTTQNAQAAAQANSGAGGAGGAASSATTRQGSAGGSGYLLVEW